jgi:hypothetical protein
VALDGAGGFSVLAVNHQPLTASGNLVTGNTAASRGGGANIQCSAATLIGNTFTGNRISDPANAATHEGGGLRAFSCGGNPALIQSGNIFDGNTVGFASGTGDVGTGDAAGGGEIVFGHVLTSRNDRFIRNRLQVPRSPGDGEGSGLALEGCGSDLPASRVENAVVAGNAFTGAAEGSRNGGLYVGLGCGTGPAKLTLLDATVAGNAGGGPGTAGLFGGPDDALTLNNSIVAGNSGGADLSGFASKTVGFSDACPLLPGAGNVCANPLLADAAAGNAHETNPSPTLDRGSNGLIAAGLVTDFEAQARIQGPSVDMGADESLDASAPGVSRASLTNTSFAVGKGRTAVSARKRKKPKRGTTIRYTLSEAASVTLRIDRRLKGRRVKKGKKRVCIKPTRKNRKKRRCTRLKRAGTLTRKSKAGKNSVKFTGRIGRRALKRGSYQLTMVATDAAGNKSKPKRLRFKVVRAR